MTPDESPQYPVSSAALQMAIGKEATAGTLPAGTLSPLIIQAEQCRQHTVFSRPRWLQQTALMPFPAPVKTHVSARLTMDMTDGPGSQLLWSAIMDNSWLKGWPSLSHVIADDIIAPTRRAKASYIQLGSSATSLSLLRGFSGQDNALHYAGMQIAEARLRLAQDRPLSLQIQSLGLKRSVKLSPSFPAQPDWPVFTPVFTPFYFRVRWDDEETDAQMHVTALDCLFQKDAMQPLYRLGTASATRLVSGQKRLEGQLQIYQQDEQIANWRDAQRRASLTLVMGNAAGSIFGLDIPAIRLLEDEQQTQNAAGPAASRLRFEAVLNEEAASAVTLFYVPAKS